MKNLIKIAIVMIELVVVGCSNNGNRSIAKHTPATVANNIQIGHSTMQSVHAIYGEPWRVQQIAGVTVWRYEFTRLKPKVTNFIPIVDLFAWGATGYQKVLEIQFKDNVVQDYFFKTLRINQERGNVYYSTN